jgi:UPF0755 protein
MGRRALVRLFVVLFIVPVLLLAGLYFFIQDRYSREGPLRQTKIILIEKGAGANKIAALLLKSGVINSTIFFHIGVRYNGFSGKLRAGEYKFLAKASMSSVVSLITSGQTVKRRITIPEGLLAIQIKKLLCLRRGLSEIYQKTYGGMASFCPRLISIRTVIPECPL